MMSAVFSLNQTTKSSNNLYNLSEDDFSKSSVIICLQSTQSISDLIHKVDILYLCMYHFPRHLQPRLICNPLQHCGRHSTNSLSFHHIIEMVEESYLWQRHFRSTYVVIRPWQFVRTVFVLMKSFFTREEDYFKDLAIHKRSADSALQSGSIMFYLLINDNDKETNLSVYW